MNRSPCLLLLAFALSVPACAPSTPVEDLPTAEKTLLEVSRRLGEMLSLKDQARLQGQGSLVLKHLTQAERYALGRNLVRFQIDAPAKITIAAPVGFEPFWLADQGFIRRPETIKASSTTYSLHSKDFDRGWVGLGINSLDRRSPDHYAAFVQGATTSNFQPETAGHGLPILMYGWPQDGSPTALLPDDLCTSVLISIPYERHASALLTGPPWKTHVPSKNQPDQIVVSYGTEAATTLGWNWRTRPEVDQTFVRLFEAESDSGANVQFIKGVSRTVESFGLLNDPIIRRHCARASGLKPSTLYAYSVGNESVGWSSWRTVKTGPDPSLGKPQTIMYLGDAQCGLEGWGALLQTAVRRHPETQAILLAGDLVDRGNERSNWDHFFLRASAVIDRVPFLPAVGNHEYLDRGPVHYSASFTLPENGPAQIGPGLAYSCRIGNALVVVLDSNLAKYDEDLARAQSVWMESQFQNSDAPWRLVMFHHPVYASHPTRENPEIARAWVDVFDRNRVDLVLQGHDHAYLRTHPMVGGRVVASPDAFGTTYVVSVSGEKYVDQATREYSAKAFTKTSTYQLLRIDPSQQSLLYLAFDAQGKELDRLELRKPATSNAFARSDRAHSRQR